MRRHSTGTQRRARLGRALLLAVAGWTWGGPASAAICGYVVNEGDDSVSVVDLTTRTVLRVVPVGEQPSAVAITHTDAQGTVALVTNRAGHSLSILSLDQGMSLPSVSLTEDPTAIAASADGIAYVVHPATSTLTVVDVARLTGTVQSVPGRPIAVALAPSAGAVLMVDASANHLLVRDDGNPALVSTYRVGAMPSAIAFDPSTGLAYVAGNPMAIFDPMRPDVTGQFSPPVGTVTAIAVDTDRAALVVAVQDEAGGTVSIVHTADLSGPRERIDLGANVDPTAIAVDPTDGAMALVTDHANDQLLLVDLDEGTVSHIATGHQPVALAVAEIADSTCWPTPVEPTATPTPLGRTCAGDCDGDGAVAINELILGVSIALGGSIASQCPALDSNSDSQVAIAELIAAVGSALNGCG